MNIKEQTLHFTNAEFHIWLIENKKIFVDVKPIDDWEHWCYTILYKDISSPFYEVKNELEFQSYNEALSHGIQFVLNELEDMETGK